MNKIAVALISGYQEYISPRKGFSCAYRILHGDESCSHYIKRMFLTSSLVKSEIITRDSQTSRFRFTA